MNYVFSPSSSLSLGLQEPDPLFFSWWGEDFLQWESHLIADANGDYRASVKVYGHPEKVNTEVIVGNAKVFQSGGTEFNRPFHLEAYTPERAIVRIRLSTAILVSSKSKIEVVMDVKGILYPFSSVLACNLLENLPSGEIFTSTVTVSPAMAKRGRIHSKMGDELIAGEFAEITVESCDTYGNAVVLSDPSLYLRATFESAGNSESLSNEFFGPNSVYFTRTVSGIYNVHVSLISWIGLSATYFASSDLAVPISSRAGAIVDFSTSDGQQQQVSLAIGEPFSVRWAGVIRPSTSHIFTMYAGVCDADERIRVWIDNILVVDMWQSLSETSISGIASVDEADRYYDIKVEYKQMEGCARAQLSWSRDALQNPILPVELGLEEESVNSPLEISFVADTASIHQIKLFGNSLTLGTSCAENSFTIRARDQYGNIAKLSDENMKVRFSPLPLLGFSQLLDAPAEGLLDPICDNISSDLCIVNYKLKASGNFLLRIEVKSLNVLGKVDWLAVRGTPLEVVILPGQPKSFAVLGNAISIASAGATSEFTVFAFDCGGSKADLHKPGLISLLSILASQGVESWQPISFQVQIGSDGTLHIQYQVTSSGNMFLSVLYHGLHIGDSPYAVQCLPGAVSGPESVVTITLSSTTAGFTVFKFNFIS